MIWEAPNRQDHSIIESSVMIFFSPVFSNLQAAATLNLILSIITVELEKWNQENLLSLMWHETS